MSVDPCRHTVADAVAAVLQELNIPATEASAAVIEPLLGRPPETALGDFALPCFRFAKALRQAPAAIATQVAEKLSSTAPVWLKKAAGVQGFLNLELNPQWLATQVVPPVLNAQAFSEPFGKDPKRVMIEYSQPNTHKEFHVGHARNVCLGSALVKLYRYCGNTVTAVNYFGDEGTHIAKCLWYIDKTKAISPLENRGAWLGTMYAEATRLLDSAQPEEKTQFHSDISAVLRGIESKKGRWFDLWRETRQWSLDDFKDIYQWLGVEFDHDFFESDVSEESQTLVDEYLQKGVFTESDGAVGADLKEYKLGFMIARKRDGNTLYATKDLVLAKHKFRDFHIDLSIYVVASEQNHHFKQVFKTLDLMGFEAASRCHHLSYGMVVLPDGKMSSRAGNTVTFAHLKQSLLTELNEYLKRYEGQWSDDEINEAKYLLCVGAIKYGMLAVDPVKDVIFDLAAWLSFEGNSGPYLMYGFSRAQSVLEKAREAGVWQDKTVPPMSGDEELYGSLAARELLHYLEDFHQAVWQSCHEYKPSLLCHHLFYMTKAFNRFYADVPILKAASPAQQKTRLALVAAFAKTLQQGLALLGITPTRRM